REHGIPSGRSAREPIGGPAAVGAPTGAVPIKGVGAADEAGVGRGGIGLPRSIEARIDERAIVRGIAAARWPGRLEWIEGRPGLLLDGAHNPAGARALAGYLARLDTRPVLVFGAMRDKDIAGMLAEI